MTGGELVAVPIFRSYTTSTKDARRALPGEFRDLAALLAAQRGGHWIVLFDGLSHLNCMA